MAVDYKKYIESTGVHYISNSGHDENNRYNSGSAGDQTGKEWELKAWYNRPWTVVLRYPDPAVGIRIAELGIAAALNNKIGYDQYQRTTYWNELQKSGYDPSKITTACEADCTAGVTANCKAVGYLMGIDKLKNLATDTYSGNMKSRFVAAGFKALTSSKYLTSTAYLLPGDILLYEGHHAATNITYGKKSEKYNETTTIEIPVIEKTTEVVTVPGDHDMIVDVSKWQETIDWDKLAPNVAFCVIKASSGKGKDPYYDRNSSECKRLGIPFHAYHFLYCQSVSEAKKEAKIFADSIKGTEPLFYVLDVEAESKIPVSGGKEIIEAFVSELKRLLGDIRVAIYIGHELYPKYGLEYDDFSYVWIPRYGSNNGTVLSSIKPAYPCDIWQYTSKGKIAGINGNVDLDILTGTKPLEFFVDPDKKNEPVIDEKKEAKVVEETVKTLTDDTPGFTGKKLAEYCLKVYQDKWVYWYGTYGQKCTESLYNSKKNQYPDHYGSSRTSAYKKDITEGKRCADCVGLIKSYFWSGGDINTIPKYGTNHCPDVSANGMLNQCSQTGAISTIPDEPGLVVWRSGHIGVYVGNGYTVELKGFDYDCQKNKLSYGSWTKWGRLPSSMITYTSEPVSNPTDDGDRFLQNGSKGEDVKRLQTNLIRLGYDCGRWGADGDFGDATESALETFQRDHELIVNGVYDASTIAAMEAAIQAFDEPAKDPVKVKIVGGNCYVRTEPNTSGRKLGVAKSGSVCNYCGKTSENGWNMINYNGNFAWVSGKYSKLID